MPLKTPNAETEPFVSVIVPTLADAERVGTLLPALAGPPGVEVVVVEARGARDEALERVRERHPWVAWRTAEPGRAAQMNAGAAAARGRWLVFLHADCRLPDGWLDELRQVDRDGRAVGGSFRFALDSPARAARVIERGVAWRVRWLGLPYGDQALFAQRRIFEALGGYRLLPLMEDVDFVRRLRRRGRLHHSPLAVVGSARRWERDGWVRRTVANLILVVLYFVGVGPDRLARIYYRQRPGRLETAPPALHKSDS